MKVISLSLAAGFVTLSLWISMIWLTSVNLLAEGPDTRTAAFLAKPIEWWASFVSPASGALVDAIGFQRHWAGTLVGTVFWLGPIIALLSVAWLPLIRRYFGAHRTPPNKSFERTREG
jgi:hypothetical protein